MTTLRRRLDREDFARQAQRARLVSTFQRAPVSLYVIREDDITRATVVGHAISRAHIDIVRDRGGSCRHVCTFNNGKKTA